MINIQNCSDWAEDGLYTTHRAINDRGKNLRHQSPLMKECETLIVEENKPFELIRWIA